MAGRGLHLALNDSELKSLMEFDQDGRADFIANELEEAKFDTPDACETDKSWAYIHSALNGVDPDGPLEFPKVRKGGIFARFFGQPKAPNPLSDARYAIIGCTVIGLSDDYFIGLVPKEKVQLVASDLAALTVEALGEMVKAVHRQFGASGTPEDAAEYAMGWYPGLVAFFATAAGSGKNVIFTVDF